ncbi:MAG: acyl-CoA desaturase [Reichenbachiella sp.]
MELPVVRFNREEGADFVSELRKRVNDYFVDNNLSKFGNSNMVVKTIFMLTLYFVPFGFIISGMIESFWFMMFLWFVMGLGMCGIGASVVHDANHGSYSRNKWINHFLGSMLNLVGSYHVTWKIQHNVLHHSSTNVHDFDQDLDNPFMRFSPFQERKKIFKFQAYYAPFLYGFMSLNKMFNDFGQIIEYKKKKLLTGQGVTIQKAMIQNAIGKLVYLGVTLVLPIILLDMAWWQIVIGFFVMHFVCGLMLSLIFQAAHVIEKTSFYTADEESSLDNCWAIHQLNTTANFAKNSRWLSWLIGGLNFQVEHHLFPHICHVHYQNISEIVKRIAKEYNIEYHEYPTFFSGIRSHFKMLNQLGRA